MSAVLKGKPAEQLSRCDAERQFRSAKAATPAKKPAAKPAPPPPAAAKDNRSLFARHAPGLIEKGYSPVPRNAGKGRTDRPGWSDFCGRQASPEELREWLRIPGADIVLACGFGGLVAVDVDDTRPEILDAVRGALPHCTVARFGSKGFALLCRHVDGPQHMGSIYATDEQRKSPLVELMGLGRVITVPPSRHAKTGKSYLWIDPATGEPRADDWGLPPLHELPAIDDDDLRRLREALAPWSRKPKPPRPLPEGPAPVLNSASEKRYRAYALKGLNDAAATLAGLSEGRPSELFRAVCSLGWAVAHGVLSEVEFTAAFANACQQNGLVSRDGRHAIEASIRSGLGRAENDPLHVFAEREPGKAARGRAAPQRKAAPDKAVLVSDVPEPPQESEWGARTGPAAAIADSKALTVQPAVKGDGDKALPWGEPEPLVSKIEPVAYPLSALPEQVRAAVEEVRKFVKAPLPMVALSAITAISVAVQALVDVRRDEELLSPVSIFSLIIADSGERKTQVDKMHTREIRRYQERQAERAKPLLKDYQASLAAWEAKDAGITDRIRRATSNNKPTEAHKSDLHAHWAKRPERHRVPKLLREDATPEGLAKRLQNDWPSAGVISNEAGIVFGAHGMGSDSIMRNMALLNKLWDGGRYQSDRTDDERCRDVHGARLTMGLMVQESILREFLGRSKGLARGSGFIARFLVAWPESTMGTRFYEPPTEGMPALTAFNERLGEILDYPAPIDENGTLSPAEMALSPEAKAAWAEYHDVVEAMLGPAGELSDVKDLASKSADNAARLAALFAFFERGIGVTVKLGDFLSAREIALWHLNEGRRFLGEFSMPAELAGAGRLEEWLIRRCRANGSNVVSRRDVQNAGPYGLRDRAPLDSALGELCQLGRVREEKNGQKLEIHLNPALLGGGE